jgi:DNA/RNA-binding domain of Phe-tRNA-synthetase-like protein
MEEVVVEPHPLLCAGLIVAEFPAPLGSLASPFVSLLRADAEAPLQRDEQVRREVRDLLRHGGYKPTGRGKPASEYLVKAATDGRLGSINVAVDACNAVSLHSGLPISVVDLDRASPPFSIATGRAGERYVFNASGQEIELEGLLCLCDADGPCGNAVKDSQRTKTSESTRRTLSVVWGCTSQRGRLDRAMEWYAELLESLGASNSYRVVS